MRVTGVPPDHPYSRARSSGSSQTWHVSCTLVLPGGAGEVVRLLEVSFVIEVDRPAWPALAVGEAEALIQRPGGHVILAGAQIHVVGAQLPGLVGPALQKAGRKRSPASPSGPGPPSKITVSSEPSSRPIRSASTTGPGVGSSYSWLKSCSNCPTALTSAAVARRTASSLTPGPPMAPNLSACATAFLRPSVLAGFAHSEQPGGDEQQHGPDNLLVERGAGVRGAPAFLEAEQADFDRNEQADGGTGQQSRGGQHRGQRAQCRGGHADDERRDRLHEEQRADGRYLPVSVGLAPQVEVDDAGDDGEDRADQDQHCHRGPQSGRRDPPRTAGQQPGPGRRTGMSSVRGIRVHD